MTINTNDQVAEYMSYNPETGIVCWKKNTGRKAKVGKPCGRPDKDGYLRVGFLKRDYKLHSVCWFLYYGYWPKVLLDHKNRIKNDNRICNLREANSFQNMANSTLRKNNKSGHAGVFKMPSGRWRVIVRSENVPHYIGTFKDLELAVQARNLAAERLHGEFANKTQT